MDVSTLLIAVGLAMDSFSVSISNGIASRRFELKSALRIALFFGLFQAGMLLIGWLAGTNVLNLISGFDHWIAFFLLTLIGCRMIYESIRKKSKRLIASASVLVLLMLSIATSIDALAVGLSLSFVNVMILVPALATGIVTFTLSFSGVYLGDRIGYLVKNKVEILGGIILIIIGIQMLFNHIISA